MRRLRYAAIALTTEALGVSAPAAKAADIDLSWDACVATGGSPVAARAAGAPGPYTFTLNARNLTGQVRWTQFVFELRSPAGLPDAWRFDAAGCHAGGIQFETSSVSKTCPAVGSLPSSSVVYALDPSGRAATLTVGALYGSSSELLATKNYLLGRVLLDFSAATPTGSGSGCEGLDAPVCITLVEATVQRVGVAGPESLLPGQGFLTWNDPGGLTACSGRSLRGIRVEEFMTACAAFVPEAQFLELTPPAAGTTLPGELRLRTEDASGAVLANVDVIPAKRAGEPWSVGGSWLLGTEVFAQAAGLSPDGNLAPFLARDAGRIVLYDARPGGPVLQDLRYGGEAPIAAPVAGQSVVLTPGGYQPTTVPLPRNFAGEGTAGIDCPLPRTAAPFAIRQIAYACFPGSTAGQFVEVVSLTDSAWTGNLVLEVTNEDGVRLAQRAQLFGSGSSGTIVPGRRSWIVATSAFQAATGFMPDQIWSGFVPGSRTTFRLYPLQLETIAEVSLGAGGIAPAPQPGTSVRFLPDSTHVALFPPDAMNGSGVPLPVSECFPADSSWADDFREVRISEIMPQCQYGDERVQFFELRADAPDQTLSSHARVDIFDSNATLVETRTGLFLPLTDGTAWPQDQTWLFASTDFAAAAGLPPDRNSPRLDPTGGRIRFHDDRLPLRTIDEVEYGVGATVAAPAPGQSIQRGLDGSFSLGPPTPTNSSGATSATIECPCPVARISGLGWQQPALITSASAFDTTLSAGRVSFDRRSPQIRLETALHRNPRVELDDRYTLLGGQLGQEVVVIAYFHSLGFEGGGCSGHHGCSGGAGVLSWATADTSGGEYLVGTVDRYTGVPVRVRVGEPFVFRWSLQLLTHGYSWVYVQYSTYFEFANLPQGMRMESCMGYADDSPVAAMPALLQSSVEPGVVRLEWSPPDDVNVVSVERRTEASGWRSIGTAESSSRQSVKFEDRQVEPGWRYAYRITWGEPGGGTGLSGETWVDVPLAAFSARLAAGTLARAPFDLALTLPSREAVSAELFDLRGRRLAARAWTPDAAGAATFRLDPDRALAPGVYWIRVVQGTERATLRAVVLKKSR